MAHVASICPGCGTHAQAGGRFCSACGTPVQASGELSATSAIPVGDADATEKGGFNSFREITLARQLVYFRLESEEQKEAFLEALRAIGDLDLAAPFPIRSAFVVRHYVTPAYGEMEGYLYDEPLGPDRLPPDGKSFAFVFWKDLRTKLWGKPADLATYGRWVLFSREEYDDLRKRLKF